MDFVNAFREKMRTDGIICNSEIICDGELHRFHVDGDSANSNNGWYILYNDSIPAGAFGCWRRGINKTWCFKSKNTMTSDEWAKHLSCITSAQEKYARKKNEIQTEARKKAETIWSNAEPANNNHPYLLSKNIQSNDLRIDSKSRLIVPLFDIDNKLHSLQFISPEGEKKFLFGGLISGNYFQIGNINKTTDKIYIGEGYATCMTIFQASDSVVVCAFNCGNLLPVVRKIRKAYAEAEIIIAADNDIHTHNNPGLTKAKEAAASINAQLVYPVFADLDAKSKLTDFNDLMRVAGLDAVKTTLLNKHSPNDLIIDGHSINLERDKQEQSNKSSTIKAVSLSEFLSMCLAPRENILEPWLPRAGLCMVYATRGVGKTYFALEVTMAIAYGANFLAYKATKPVKVLYIDGEMPANTIQERLASIEKRMIANSDMIEPDFITPDLQDNFMPDLSSIEGQEIIAPYTEQADLIVIDNISTLSKYGKENEAESWAPLQEWALKQRKKGKSVLFIHHAGKNGKQRGTSKREDILDTVITLKHPSNYEPSMGACFEIHFEKARGITGDAAAPILCSLTENGWEYSNLEQSNYQMVVELYKEGLKQNEIAEELDISKGQVSKLIKKAKALGEIK